MSGLASTSNGATPRGTTGSLFSSRGRATAVTRFAVLAVAAGIQLPAAAAHTGIVETLRTHPEELAPAVLLTALLIVGIRLLEAARRRLQDG